VAPSHKELPEFRHIARDLYEAQQLPILVANGIENGEP
jgi:hypothetical protein